MGGRTDAERAEIYSMVGGVPMYLNLFDNGRAVEDVVIDAFLRYDAPLRGETERLLSQEIPGYAQYVDVVEAVASGRGRIKDISDRTDLETSVVSMCLKRLSSLGYVDRETPFGSDGGRSTRYVLCDNLFGFYYRFLFPGDGSSVYDSEDRLKADCGRIMARLPEHTGRVFEAMCAQYIARTTEYRRLGRWWGPDAKSRTVEEIDIVGSRRTDIGDVGLFAECKYSNERVGADALDGLIRKSALVGGFASREYMLFSKGGFTPDLERRAAETGARLVTLEDMYALGVRRRRPPESASCDRAGFGADVGDRIPVCSSGSPEGHGWRHDGQVHGCQARTALREAGAGQQKSQRCENRIDTVCSEWTLHQSGITRAALRLLGEYRRCYKNDFTKASNGINARSVGIIYVLSCTFSLRVADDAREEGDSDGEHSDPCIENDARYCNNVDVPGGAVRGGNVRPVGRRVGRR